MKKSINIIIAIFLMFFLIATLLLPFYYIYQSGKNFIEEIQSQTKNRAFEIATALDTMSGESIYYDNFISLSNVLAKIVEFKNQKDDPYKILEIFLLDNQNRLLAHSNIFKVAKDHQDQYDAKKYKLGRILFANNNIDIEIIGYSEVELPKEIAKIDSFIPFLPMENLIKTIIKKSIPDLLANEFHVFSSVYPPDETLPKGSLHMMIKNYGIQPLISYWIKQMFYVFVFSLITFFILLIVFVKILYNIFFTQGHESQYEELVILPESVHSKDKKEVSSIDAIKSNVSDKDILKTQVVGTNEVERIEQKEDAFSKNRKIIFLKDFKKNKRNEDKQKLDKNFDGISNNKEALQSQQNEKSSKKQTMNYENIIDALPIE